ncbi:DUF6916 family protein [Isoalcanivorax indicus]|uniref:DUF6916 family protein n=1 Tax=Isoalcanivorax indicus TaxID=2202653 RepID=UPI000DBA119F|nr:hypothetical protein [Isoalcanivorax indicus]
MKRRTFVAGLAAAPWVLAGCGADSQGNRSGASGHPPAPVVPQGLSRRHDFGALEGDIFYVAHPRYGSVDARLVGVEDNTRDAQLEQFALRFELPPGSALQDALYRVEHAQGGRFDLFMQRSSDDSVAGEGYVAFFSHLTD